MNKLAEKIAEQALSAGPITFARFMELALYCPVYGYYEKEGDTIGRGGDFMTSVSVGPLFGQLLACQFGGWLEELASATGAGTRLTLVECGSHRGQLACDVLDWLRERRSALFERIEFWIVEPSERRRLWQENTLSRFAGKAHWAGDFAELRAATERLSGVIFSNELLDAMPVHRVGWNLARQTWFEWGVAFENGRFEWTRLPFVSEKLIPVLAKVPTAFLPDGFILDLSPAAAAWWGAAAEALGQGKLMTVDYGLTFDDLLAPERSQGTLRAYAKHRLAEDVLASPGEQDLTASVNFTAVEQAGLAGGLRTELFVRQEQFLTGIAAKVWQDETAFGEWTPARTRQFQTLTHPEHLGRAFRVLVQERLTR